MKRRTKIIILAVVGLQILFIAGLLALPAAVQAVPGRYRVALMERNRFLGNITEGVIEAVAPVATALPAPAQSSPEEEVDIAEILAVSSAQNEQSEQEEAVDPTPTVAATATPPSDSQIAESEEEAPEV
ncbi:MAG: hypothetical protein ACK2UJ_10980, partial [Candidatus Promineifilaceae bacterium]